MANVTQTRLGALGEELSHVAPGVLICTAAHRPTGLIDPAGRRHGPDALAGRKAYAFCGLGRPEQFLDAVERLGADVVGRRAFDDHVDYDRPRLDLIAADARGAGAELLVTTRKDYVKLRDDPAAGMEFWQVDLALEIRSGRAELIEKIERAAKPIDPEA